MIKQRPGSNAREVIQQIKAKMEELKETTFARVWNIISRTTYPVSDASHIGRAQDLAGGVYLGIYRGVSFLAGFPVYADTSAIAVPVSLIGTFFFMQMLGFNQYADFVCLGARYRYRGG